MAACDMWNLLAGEASPAAANGRAGSAAAASGGSQSRAISIRSSNSSSSRGCRRRRGRRSGAAGSQAGQAASRAPRSAAGARRCGTPPASCDACSCCVTAICISDPAAGRRAADAVHDLAAHRQVVLERGGACSGAAGPAARAEHLQRVGPDQRGACGLCRGFALSTAASSFGSHHSSGPTNGLEVDCQSSAQSFQKRPAAGLSAPVRSAGFAI